MPNPQSKPAWALTDEQTEEREEEELDDLLQFASGLDFNMYIEDYEVSMHGQIRAAGAIGGKNPLGAVSSRDDRLASLRKCFSYCITYAEVTSNAESNEAS